MGNFKFNFLLRGQLESLRLDKFLLAVFKMLPCHEGFFGNFLFAFIARMFRGNRLNKIVFVHHELNNVAWRKMQRRTITFLFDTYGLLDTCGLLQGDLYILKMTPFFSTRTLTGKRGSFSHSPPSRTCFNECKHHYYTTHRRDS